MAFKKDCLILINNLYMSKIDKKWLLHQKYFKPIVPDEAVKEHTFLGNKRNVEFSIFSSTISRSKWDNKLSKRILIFLIKFSLIYFLSRVWRCKSRKYDESSSWQVVINRIFFVIVLFTCFGSWHFTEFKVKFAFEVLYTSKVEYVPVRLFSVPFFRLGMLNSKPYL